MLLDIRRCGSGWGGVVGHWIVDVDNNVAYDVHGRQIRTIKFKDLSLLKLLKICTLSDGEKFAAFDVQEDFVHVLFDGQQRCVLNSALEIYPDNEALHGKLLRLLDSLGG